MAAGSHTDVEKRGVVEKRAGKDESGSADEKVTSERAEDAASVRREGPEPPECVKRWTPEERAEKEKALKRKIDIRLLPAIIIMYILNYIDR